MKVVIDDCRLERMDAYTEPLEAKIKRQAAEITRLLAENEDLKNSMEIIRDNAFEAGLIRGQEEAWELARKIVCSPGYSGSELKEIFGNKGISWCISSNTYTEAAAKVADWERKKEEICVGDVVIFDKMYGLVTRIDKYLKGISENGIGFCWPKESCEKTGRHIDTGWLAQIGGDQNDNK